ncbi:MAG: tetratricopeptide repeat protein [Chloroflexota bacterium]|nr:tetratricopeptide repeat protein [Chloroflexota bacterium]
MTILPPQAMLSRLERRLPLLIGGARDLPARQRTLRDTIGWSYDLLDADEQRLFRQMAPFAGGCTLGALEAVCSHLGASPPSEELDPGADLLDVVASLVDKSLVHEVDGPDGEPRFTMLETVREFATERLESSGEASFIRRQHAEHYLQLAELSRSRLRGLEAVSWLKRLDAEHDNLRAALDWGETQSDLPDEAETSVGVVSGIELATRIAQALAWYWTFRSQLRQARERVDRLLARAREGTPARARALLVAQTLALYLGDIVEARRLGEESLATWRALGDRDQVAVALARMAYAEGLLGDPDHARSILEESSALSEDQRHATDLEHPIVLIQAMATKSAGDLDTARGLFEQSLALGSADGDTHTTLASLRHLGTLAHKRGDVDVAHRLFAESVRLARDLGDYSCTANGLAGLAFAALDAGEAERATRLLAVLLKLSEQNGYRVVSLSGSDVSVAVLRARLGEEAFAAAWAEGRAMSLEQAIAYALEGCAPA